MKVMEFQAEAAMATDPDFGTTFFRNNPALKNG